MCKFFTLNIDAKASESTFSCPTAKASFVTGRVPIPPTHELAAGGCIMKIFGKPVNGALGVARHDGCRGQNGYRVGD
jgi:hypothetical protein